MSGYPDRTTPKWVAADSAGRSATRCIPLDGCVEELRSSQVRRPPHPAPASVPRIHARSPAPQDEVMMGIDEAGRGPTLGPMVYGSAYCRVADLDKLKAMGFADSKTLTEAKREALWADLRASGFLGWRIRVLHAQEIAAGMLRRPSPYNLNAMSHDAAIGLVREVIELGVNLRHLYVDTVGDPEHYQAPCTPACPRPCTPRMLPPTLSAPSPWLSLLTSTTPSPSASSRESSRRSPSRWPKRLTRSSRSSRRPRSAQRRRASRSSPHPPLTTHTKAPPRPPKVTHGQSRADRPRRQSEDKTTLSTHQANHG